MRTLKLANPPMHGPDVGALQAALTTFGIATAADDVYGSQTGLNAYRAQYELGYLKPSHAAGDALLGYLTGKSHPSKAMVARAKTRGFTWPTSGTSGAPTQVVSHEDQVRQACRRAMDVFLAHIAELRYPTDDVRRTEGAHLIATVAELDAALADGQSVWDCSQTATVVAHVGGAGCPNGLDPSNGIDGRDWKADGFTGTLVAGCVHITKAQSKVGDMHVYGAGDGHHVATVYEIQGADRLMFSHGSDPAHLILDSVEANYQPSGGTWLRLPI